MAISRTFMNDLAQNILRGPSYTVKKGVLPNFQRLALSYETILSLVSRKSFRNFHTELF